MPKVETIRAIFLVMYPSLLARVEIRLIHARRLEQWTWHAPVAFSRGNSSPSFALAHVLEGFSLF